MPILVLTLFDFISFYMMLVSGGSRKFWWGGGFKAKTSKIRMSSPKLRLIFRPFKRFFRPKSGGLKKKKKKKRSSPKLRLIFWPDSSRLGRWGGMHPEMEPSYSK